MRVVRAAAVQLGPVLYSREGTVERVVRKIHELGRQGVQFATFPGDRRAVLPVPLVHPARPPASTESGPDFLPYTMLEPPTRGFSVRRFRYTRTEAAGSP